MIYLYISNAGSKIGLDSVSLGSRPVIIWVTVSSGDRNGGAVTRCAPVLSQRATCKDTSHNASRCATQGVQWWLKSDRTHMCIRRAKADSAGLDDLIKGKWR